MPTGFVEARRALLAGIFGVDASRVRCVGRRAQLAGQVVAALNTGVEHDV